MRKLFVKNKIKYSKSYVERRLKRLRLVWFNITRISDTWRLITFYLCVREFRPWNSRKRSF